MGEGKEVKTKEEPQAEVQERGEIFFFYRPKVNKETVRNVDDVQRLYMVLRPESGEKEVEEKQSGDTGKEASLKEARGEEPEEISEEQEHKQSPKEEEGTEADRKENSPEQEKRENSKEGGIKTDLNGASEEQERSKHSDGDEERQAGKGSESSDEHLAEGKIFSQQRVIPHMAADYIVVLSSVFPLPNVIVGKAVDITKQMLLRVIVIGRKSLPDASKRSRPYWGFVELVTKSPEDVKQVLAAEKYQTATRGERENPPCRPVGEGIYRLVRHKSGRRAHTHLVYKLELPGPEKRHEPQEALNIEPEGSYLLQIKNPEQGNPRGQGLQNKKKSTYPAHLQAQLGSNRFVAADPPDFLNYEGCELLLISASDDIEEELGLELEGTDERSDLLNLFGNWDDENRPPVKPLIEGEWA
ncbi:hypothetical protein R1sor_017983 [Riccia sorocarpa]|uniref:Uncharacterized protein n=1 Tax=Riccia sorocarpa TaxID=122646 RepID=A0ABD3I9H4_9MARC